MIRSHESWRRGFNERETMTDDWLKNTIHECKNLPSIDFIRVDRVELLNRLEQLEWYMRHRERLNVCQCTGVQKMAEYGLCFYCGRKVEVKS